MIRSSALLTVVAMALLVAGVTSASLRIIYLSIAVSILAAVTLGAGVVLRRRELFGHAGTTAAQPGRTAAEDEPAARAPAPSESARGDPSRKTGAPSWADRDRAARERDEQEPGGRAPAAGEPAGHGQDQVRDQGTPADRDTPAREEQPAAEADEASWRRMVPRYVDDLATPKREGAQPEAARTRGPNDAPARDGLPTSEAAAQARASALAQDAGSASAWARVRAGHIGQEPAGTGRDRQGPVGEAGAEELVSGASGKELPEGAPAERGPAGRDPAQGAGTEGGGAPGDEESRARAPAADAAQQRQAGAGQTQRAATPHDEAGQTAGERGPADGRGGAAATIAESREEARAGTVVAEANGGRAGRDAGNGERAAEAAGTDTGGARRAAGEGADDPEDDHATGTAGAGESPGRATHSGAAARSHLDDEVTIVPGDARYHRRGCLLIRFLGDGDLETMTRREAEAAGSVPCKACRASEPGPTA